MKQLPNARRTVNDSMRIRLFAAVMLTLGAMLAVGFLLEAFIDTLNHSVRRGEAFRQSQRNSLSVPQAAVREIGNNLLAERTVSVASR